MNNLLVIPVSIVFNIAARVILGSISVLEYGVICFIITALIAFAFRSKRKPQ